MPGTDPGSSRNEASKQYRIKNRDSSRAYANNQRVTFITNLLPSVGTILTGTAVEFGRVFERLCTLAYLARLPM